MRVILYISSVLFLSTVMGVKSHNEHTASIVEMAGELANVDKSVAANDEKPASAIVQEVPAENVVVEQPTFQINNEGTDPASFVSFAQTLVGTPYAYGSMDPSVGFDCSGFINYVAAHFNIKVPRSSVDFTNVGEEISQADAKAGDLILFTGTDSTSRVVGHMGIVTENLNGQNLEFIHSSSGKANGVTISSLEGYYSTRFVKVIRILA
ncbi:MAG TPA: C40 family peptidase [Chitinophagaceae bacterium]